MVNNNRNRAGFTLVELLIVIVVIAILAAISVVAYRGVASNAQAAAIQANLTQAAIKLETYKVDNNAYPPDQATVASMLKFDASTTLTYAASNSSSSPSYCLNAIQGTQQFSISATNRAPSANNCVVNLAVNPRGTYWLSYSVDNGPGMYGGYWHGSYSVPTATDGPNAGLPNYLRKTLDQTSPNMSNGDANIYLTNGNPITNPETSACFPVNPGGVLTVGYWIRTSHGGNNFGIAYTFFDASGTHIISNTLTVPNVPANTWKWIQISTGAAPANAVKVAIITAGATGTGTNPVTGDTYDYTGLMITQGSTIYNYADGNSSGWSWAGTANASTSFGPPV